jgi:preprotein translocase subunit SecA
MEASILSKQIENAQKKVEEQHFVSRKNVLKYDDVMNQQRMVIYDQRRRVLEGEDLSPDVHEWIDEVIERRVAEFTEEPYPEDWDLEGLVSSMVALYETTITVEELREDLKEITQDALVEEFKDDAHDRYTEKDENLEQLQEGLMRDLERYVILQVVDQRWREHLENMDYLREGVHLRAMAQKDPLVEYRGEGHAMFQELSAAIREEVVLTLFHAHVEPQDADELGQPAKPGPDGAGPNGNLSYEHETVAGSAAIAAAGGGSATPVGGGGGAVATQRIVSEEQKLGRNDPCWCGSGKKYKKCHGA